MRATSLLVALLVTACLAVGVSPTLAAAPSHSVGISAFMVGPTRATATRAIRAVEVKPLEFAFGVDLLSEFSGPADTTESVRVTLPPGLAFGPRAPDPRTLQGAPAPWSFEPTSQGCVVTGRVADCTAAGVPSDGTRPFGWLFDVVARAAGSYAIQVRVTSTGTNKPSRKLNDSAMLTVLVGERSGALEIGTPGLTRTELRPSSLQVDATVKQGGVPVRPAGVTCTVSFADAEAYGRRRYVGLSTLGAVRCNFSFNNARYLGKTLTGEITVAAGGKRVTKTFSVRIGPGNALLRLVGATVPGDGAAKAAKPPATSEWRGTLHLVQAMGTPGQPPGHASLDLQMTLLPGATTSDAGGWTQPISWVATYSSSSYSRPPCIDASGAPFPTSVGEQTVVRGRTGVRPGSNVKDHPRVGIRWDAASSKWVITLSFFGGSGGGMRLPLPTKTTSNCGKRWVTIVSSPHVQNSKLRADGTATSTTLQGRATPTGFYT